MAEVPFNAVSSSRREIKIVAQVVNRLLDRDKPLLPAYISLNEIRQIFEKVQGWTFFVLWVLFFWIPSQLLTASILHIQCRFKTSCSKFSMFYFLEQVPREYVKLSFKSELFFLLVCSVPFCYRTRDVLQKPVRLILKLNVHPWKRIRLSGHYQNQWRN